MSAHAPFSCLGPEACDEFTYCTLHAAAPALLEALEAMCERYDAPHWAVNIKARAAIAQAKGKSK